MLGFPETDSVSIVYSGGEGPRKSGQFQGLPAAILPCLLSCLKIFHAGLQDDKTVSISEDTVTHQHDNLY